MSAPTQIRRASHLRAGDVIEVNGRTWRVHLPPMDCANLLHQVVLVVLESSGAGGWVLSPQALILPRRSAVSRVVGGIA